jgi:hypothetical protein
MALRTPQEFRDRAKEFRDMASAGEDARLREALLLVADEFEAEAAWLEGLPDPLDNLQ